MKTTVLAVITAPFLLLFLTAMMRVGPSNPPINSSLSVENSLDMPPHIRAFLKRSCYDCHSFETRWPWYAGVPLVSGLIESDVRGGRAAMNFSEWSTTAGTNPARASALLFAACEAVRQGLMPKRPYPLLHPEARASARDADMFCEWTQDQVSLLRKKAGIHK